MPLDVQSCPWHGELQTPAVLSLTRCQLRTSTSLNVWHHPANEFTVSHNSVLRPHYKISLARSKMTFCAMQHAAVAHRCREMRPFKATYLRLLEHQGCWDSSVSQRRIRPHVVRAETGPSGPCCLKHSGSGEDQPPIHLRQVHAHAGSILKRLIQG